MKKMKQLLEAWDKMEETLDLIPQDALEKALKLLTGE